MNVRATRPLLTDTLKGKLSKELGMKLNDYLYELYRTQNIVCYEEMTYDQKSYATSLVIDDMSAVEFPDFVMNYRDPLSLKAAMQGILESHERNTGKDDVSFYRDSMVNIILQGAIDLARIPINDVFAEIVSYRVGDDLC